MKILYFMSLSLWLLWDPSTWGLPSSEYYERKQLECWVRWIVLCLKIMLFFQYEYKFFFTFWNSYTPHAYLISSVRTRVARCLYCTSNSTSNPNLTSWTSRSYQESQEIFMRLDIPPSLSYIIWHEILPNPSLIALYKDPFKWQSNFFSGISLILFLLEIFNLTRYANYRTYDIRVHESFSKIIINLQHDRHIQHKNVETKQLIVFHAFTAQLQIFLIVTHLWKLRLWNSHIKYLWISREES